MDEQYLVKLTKNVMIYCFKKILEKAPYIWYFDIYSCSFFVYWDVLLANASVKILMKNDNTHTTLFSYIYVIIYSYPYVQSHLFLFEVLSHSHALSRLFVVFKDTHSILLLITTISTISSATNKHYNFKACDMQIKSKIYISLRRLGLALD